MELPRAVANITTSDNCTIEELSTKHEILYGGVVTKSDLKYAWETKLDAAQYSKREDVIKQVTRVLDFISKSNDEVIHDYSIRFKDGRGLFVFYSESDNQVVLMETT